MCILGAFNLFCFDKFFRNLPSHDASHLGVDVIFLSSILDGAAEKSKDSDELVSAEEPKVVDRVATSFEEVVLIGVVVLESSEIPIGFLLAKESASMRKVFISSDHTRTLNNDLSEGVGVNHVLLDEFLNKSMRIIAFIMINFKHRVDVIALYKEVSECSIRNT